MNYVKRSYLGGQSKLVVFRKVPVFIPLQALCEQSTESSSERPSHSSILQEVCVRDSFPILSAGLLHSWGCCKECCRVHGVPRSPPFSDQCAWEGSPGGGDVCALAGVGPTSGRCEQVHRAAFFHLPNFVLVPLSSRSVGMTFLRHPLSEAGEWFIP